MEVLIYALMGWMLALIIDEARTMWSLSRTGQPPRRTLNNLLPFKRRT